MISRRTFVGRILLGWFAAVFAGAGTPWISSADDDTARAPAGREYRIRGRLQDDLGSALPGIRVVLLQAAPDGSHMHPGWHAPAAMRSGAAYVQQIRTGQDGTFEFGRVLTAPRGTGWPVLMARKPGGWSRITSWRVL